MNYRLNVRFRSIGPQTPDTERVVNIKITVLFIPAMAGKNNPGKIKNVYLTVLQLCQRPPDARKARSQCGR